MIEKNIPEHCSAMSSYLVEQLTQLKDNYNEDIVGVRGVGLLLALQFNSPIAREVVSAANAQGVLLNPVLPDAIRFMPSLIINKSDIDECITKLESALKSTLSGR